MSGKRAVWPVVLASAVGIAILCSLGTWQLRRLEWKEDLLAAIAAKSVEEPTSLAEVLARFQQCGDVNFTRVRLGGHFLDGQEKLVVTAFEGGAGYEVVAPLVTPDNFLVLVDRGIIPETMESEAGGAGYNPMGPVELVAAVRLRSARPGYFDPGNDASANRWYWWDVPAMLATT